MLLSASYQAQNSRRLSQSGHKSSKSQKRPVWRTPRTTRAFPSMPRLFKTLLKRSLSSDRSRNTKIRTRRKLRTGNWLHFTPSTPSMLILLLLMGSLLLPKSTWISSPSNTLLLKRQRSESSKQRRSPELLSAKQCRQAVLLLVVPQLQPQASNLFRTRHYLQRQQLLILRPILLLLGPIHTRHQTLLGILNLATLSQDIRNRRWVPSLACPSQTNMAMAARLPLLLFPHRLQGQRQRRHYRHHQRLVLPRTGTTCQVISLASLPLGGLPQVVLPPHSMLLSRASNLQ